jgi:hypothetical protein
MLEVEVALASLNIIVMNLVMVSGKKSNYGLKREGKNDKFIRRPRSRTNCERPG